MAGNTTKFTSIIEEENQNEISLESDYLYETEKGYLSSTKIGKSEKKLNQQEAINVHKLDDDNNAFETAKEFDQVNESGRVYNKNKNNIPISNEGRS